MAAQPPRARGVLTSMSAVKLSLLLATVAIACAGTITALAATPRAATVEVKVFMPKGATGTSCERVRSRARHVRPPAVLRGAMAALLRGPTRLERQLGYRGWFSSRTADKLRSVRLVNGVARIDFRDLRRVIPNASTSCGSALLLAQLDRTAKQFPAVRRTVYSINGSVKTFYDWLQRDAPAS